MRDIKPVPEGSESVATPLASDRGHSSWGGSSIYRNLRCLDAARLSSLMPDRPSSDAAQSGTDIHDAVDNALTKWKPGVTTDEAIEASPLMASGLSDDDLWVARYCVDVVINRLNELAFAGGSPKLYTELRVSIDDHDDFWGYADCVIIHDGGFDVIDYKTGRVGVEIRDDDRLNDSAAFYALGVLDSPIAPSQIEQITCWIVQPRAGGVKVTDITIEELELFRSEIVLARGLADGDHVTAQPGDWCRYCDAKPRCLAHYNYLMEGLIEMYQDPALLDRDQIADVLGRMAEVRSWLDDVEGFAIHQIQSGEEIPGWGVMPTRATRKWINEQAVRERLRLTNLAEDDYAPRKLLSPAQMGKVTKETSISLDDLIEAKSSGVKLQKLEG